MISLDMMEAVDINSAWRGVPPRVLMENAGANLVRELEERKNPNKKGLIYAGTGNNGGDGFVAARHLVNREVDVEVILIGKPENISTSHAKENFEILKQLDDSVNIHKIRDSKQFRDLELGDVDVAMDAMLGTGVTGAPKEPVSTAIRDFNQKGGYKIAVDVPTGVNPETGEPHETASRCDLTVTFHDNKPGIDKAPEEFTGEVVPVDIGTPRSAYKRTGPGDVKLAETVRSETSHKGQNGRVLIIGGGSKYAGAPALAGLSALRTGVDLVTLAVPSRAAGVVNSFSPDLITHDLPGGDLSPEALEELEELVARSSAVIMGPGLGTERDTRKAVVELLDMLIEDYPEKPVLLDADGLKIAADRRDLLGEGSFVLTPHSGEFEIFAGSTLSDGREGKIKEVSKTASETNTHIVLKGPVDIVSDPNDGHLLNDTGNPGMTVGGTGDVLSGVIGGFLSRGAAPFHASSAGVFLTGLAGDLCEVEKGYGFTASDVKDKIPIALSEAKEYW